MKHKEKPSPRRTLRLLMALCAAGFLLSAFVLFSDNREYAEGNASYRQIRLIRESSEAAGAPPPVSGGAPAGAARDGRAGGVDFAALKKINPDVAAWLTAEGTGIDYPVVRGTDNEYYLRHLFTGRQNKLGAIFMDYRNRADFSDRNTVIYGHNMKDGSMFASLTKYKSQSYYKSFPTMILYTPGGNFKVELFAGTAVDGNRESVRFAFKDERDFQSYIASLKKGSTFKSGTLVKAGDRIVTLCTCSYEFNNARYAVYGKLTPVGESAQSHSSMLSMGSGSAIHFSAIP